MLTIISFVIYIIISEYRSGNFNPIDPNKEAAQEAYKRGLAAERKKDYDLAIAEYTEAIRLGPNDNRFYYFKRAQLYNYRTREYDKAIADYKEYIRLDGSYLGYYIIGDIYFKLEDFANAISYYEQSLQLKPNDSDVKKKLEIAKEKAR